MPDLLSSQEVDALLLSLRVACWCVAVSVVPGIAVAWLLARRRFPGHTLLDAIVHLPLVLPPVVVGYVLLVTLGRGSTVGGWLEETLGIRLAFTWRAAVLASAVVGFPLLVRSARLAMELADRRLEEAARTLGAPPLRAFLTVTLPLAAPGIVTGMILSFGRSLGEFGATITFAGNIAGESQTLPLALYTFANVPGGDAAALRLVTISVTLSLLALLACELLTRRWRRAAER